MTRWLTLAALTACAPWTADPASSTEVELAGDLSAAQVAAVYNAVLEVNAATGQEVFHVRGEHLGRREHITVTARSPDKGDLATTHRSHNRAIVHLGSMEWTSVVEHELLHCLLGAKHTDVEGDVFDDVVVEDAVLGDETLQRILALQ